MLKFYMKESRLNGVQAPVIAFDIVIVLLRLAVIADHANLGSERFVIGRDCSRFSASAKVLARIKTECRGAADRASGQPAILFAGEVLRSVGLTGIFDHDEIEAVRKFKDGVHVGHLPVEMDGNDSCDWASAAPADEFSRGVFRTLLLKILGQSLR